MLLFFFFNQKTAFEMRISDWSSDVCSSYLQGRGGSSAVAPAPHLLEKVDPWSRSASSVSGNSRGINRKRVTSVEVNSNQTLTLCQGHTKRLGVIWSSLTAH